VILKPTYPFMNLSYALLPLTIGAALIVSACTDTVNTDASPNEPRGGESALIETSQSSTLAQCPRQDEPAGADSQ